MKVLFSELKKEMEDFNKRNGITRKVETKYLEDGTLKEMVGKVVLSQKLFSKQYTKDERTYTFGNYNEELTSSDLGYSIFAHCELDGTCERIEDFRNDDIEYAEIIKVVE